MLALLAKRIASILPPFLLDDEIMRSLAEPIPESMEHIFPQPTWIFAKKDKHGEMLPQNIAHRGYRAQHPENTMGAFRGAVKVGADAIETDVHLSKDGVVVLSHDDSLSRCFGVKKKIVHCDWSYLSTLRTIKSPHERLTRLQDLLEYLAQPENEKVWVLLDIKLDNDPDAIMRSITSTIESVAPTSEVPWSSRILLGAWALQYLPLCAKYLPTFSTTHIGFSTSYARRFLPYKHTSFNMLQRVLLVWPLGSSFLRDAKAHQRAVLAWTVDDECMMRWCIRERLDGVITDDPKKFGEVREEWLCGKKEVVLPWQSWVLLLWIQCLTFVFGIMLWRKFGNRKKLAIRYRAPVAVAGT